MSNNHKPKKVSITGGIGSGKTFVCRKIEALGFPVFYSDIQAKRIMDYDENIVSSVKAIFGDEAYLSGKLNRNHLASVAFKNPEVLQQLNSIVHPKVREA
jgi:dephospho-CoA kinase